MWLRVVSCIVLIPGIAIWVRTVALILIHVPKKELITTGPYSWVKHPLYTNIAVCVFPWVGFLCNTWLGVLVGIVVYVGSTLFSPREEAMLSKLFGKAWDDYVAKVRIPWL
jgi:protein-S-isoprenylcysteine O-methyltransferase Ste14